MSDRIDPNGVIIIKQGGFYYNVSGNDALIFNKHFKYKLYGAKIPRAGFPVIGLAKVRTRLDALEMNYDVLDSKGNAVVSMRFENNRYEVIEMEYTGKPRKKGEPTHTHKVAEPVERPSNADEARQYLELLARSIDPSTGVRVEDTVLSNPSVSESIRRIVEIIDDLVAKTGEREAMPVAAVPARQPEFTASEIDKSVVSVTDSPVRISGFAGRINKQADAKGMKHLTAGKISKWLIAHGFLSERTVTVVREVKEIGVTESSASIGIIDQEKVDNKTGEVKNAVVLTREAQEFILDNLENIAEGKSPNEAEGANAVTAREGKVDNPRERERAATEPDTPEAESVTAVPEMPVYTEPADKKPAEKTEEKREVDCLSCRFAKSGECFPRKEICPEYEPAYIVPKSERDAWPEYGDATAFRLNKYGDRR